MALRRFMVACGVGAVTVLIIAAVFLAVSRLDRTVETPNVPSLPALAVQSVYAPDKSVSSTPPTPEGSGAVSDMLRQLDSTPGGALPSGPVVQSAAPEAGGFPQGASSPQSSSVPGDVYSTPTAVSMYRVPQGLGITTSPKEPTVDAFSGPAESAGQEIAEAVRDPDEDACAPAPGQIFGAVRLVERDWRVGVCFPEPVRVEGNVRLWHQGGALGLTELSRAAAASAGGVRLLWFDRGAYPDSFYLIDWRRDPEYGDRVTLVATGEEIVYDLPDFGVGAISDLRRQRGEAEGYVLRVSKASVATDRLVIDVEGYIDPLRRYFMQVNNPFGREDCRHEDGVMFAPVLADGGERYSATFAGYMNACVAVDGQYFASPRYSVRVELLDGSGVVLHAADLWSDEFEVEMSARAVSYGQFRDALLSEINRTRVDVGVQPLVAGDLRLAQSHAESMIDGCYASHWDAGGLKPYMRYAALGGVQASAEVWVGTSSYCINDGEARLLRDEDVLALAQEAVARWSLSPVHAAVLFSPHFHLVSHGLAYDERNWRVVAVLESAFLESTGTSVSGVDADGRVWASGMLTVPAYEAGYRIRAAEVRYDPPPVALSRGQLARTSFYDNGAVLMILADRVGSRSEDIVVYPDPQEMAGAPDPVSEEEAYGLFQAARVPQGAYTAVYEFMPVDIHSDGRRFEFSVEPAQTVARLCVGPAICSAPTPGIYTVRLLASVNEGRLVEAGGSSSWVGIDRSE